MAAFLVFIVLWQAMYLYVDDLWYGSLGFDSRFWYVLLGWGVFAIFALLTFVILRGGFYVLDKWFGTDKMVPKRIALCLLSRLWWTIRGMLTHVLDRV